MSLIEKIKKARQIPVPVRDFMIIVRRPTDLEWFEIKGRINPRQLLDFVDGWDKVTEGHIINGGDPHPVPFDLDVAKAWLEDDPQLMGQVIQAVIDGYEQHAAARGEAAKN